MEDKKSTLRTWITKLSEQKQYRTMLLAAGLICIGILFLSGILGKQSKDTDDTSDPLLLSSDQTASDYAKELEESLSAMLCRIKGVGEVQVLVTIEKGVENVYATEQKTSKQVTSNQGSETTAKSQENDNTETTYIVIKDADGGQQAIAVTQIQPVVKGVVVVCDGGSDATVEQQIVNAVTTALDISSTKVCVVSAK
jgi:stage III sporulation protein AG